MLRPHVKRWPSPASAGIMTSCVKNWVLLNSACAIGLNSPNQLSVTYARFRPLC